MSNSNPYARYLEGRDLFASLAETPERYRAVLDGWPADRYARSFEPGKWTARQILLHLAQSELVFGVRLRFAATSTEYVVQPFEQDDWMQLEAPGGADGAAAFQAYYAMRQMNLPLYRSLSRDTLERRFTHPERGVLPVRWILELTAGHEIHHLGQIERIAP
jgi:uncharacterized damage-inducible protein DinB